MYDVSFFSLSLVCSLKLSLILRCLKQQNLHLCRAQYVYSKFETGANILPPLSFLFLLLLASKSVRGKSCEIEFAFSWHRWPSRTHIQNLCFTKAFFSNFNKKSCLIYTLCHLHDLFRSRRVREFEHFELKRGEFQFEKGTGTHKTLWQAPNGIQLSEICGNAYQFQESNLSVGKKDRETETDTHIESGIMCVREWERDKERQQSLGRDSLQYR